MAKQVSVDDFIDASIRGEVTDLNNPDCIDCAECCSLGAMITEEEFKKLKRFLRKDKKGKYLYQKGLNLFTKHLKENNIYWICLFSENKRCRIYNIRPQVCRDFHCKEELRNPEFVKDDTKKHLTIYDLFKKDIDQWKKGKR